MKTINERNFDNLRDGFFTVVYKNGEHRTLRVKTQKTGSLAGKTMLGFLSGTDNTSDYTFCAFLDNGTIRFWRKFREENDSVRLSRIVRAFEIVNDNIHETGRAFAMNSGNCYICGRLLTNPDSIVTGIGPECAKKIGFDAHSEENIAGAYNAFAKTARADAEKVGRIRIN